MSGGGSAGDDADVLARLELSMVGEPGDPRLPTLVDAVGSVEARRAVIAGLPALGEAGRRWQQRLGSDSRRHAEQLLAASERSGLRWVVPGEQEWPDRLADLSHVEPLQRLGGTPLGLWVRGAGRLDRLAGRAVAVVGARADTAYGRHVASEIAAHGSERDWTVVSGAALGVDAAAHRAALAVGGPTLAVLACGADVAYPRVHEELLARIAATGAVVSELAPGATPSRVRFLARNRLIAGLSLGVVVVEAAFRSGALNTANWAGRLGRRVLGVPGPVTSSASAGVHQLLRDGGAVVATSGAEVLESLAGAGEHLLEVPREPERVFDQLEPAARQVVDALPARGSAGVATLAARSGLDVTATLRALATLGAAGLAERGDDGWRLGPGAARQLASPAP